MPLSREPRFDAPRRWGMGALEGRTALITGASGGMGRATAIEFAKEGAKGIGLQYSKNRVAAESVAKAVRAYGAEPVLLQADVSNRDECHGIVTTFVDRFRRLDALVCYAGYPFRKETWFAEFESLTEEAFLGPLRVDLLGSVFAAQAAIPVMRKQRRGAIVLVGSTPAITGDVAGDPVFVAQAGGLARPRGAAHLLRPDNVHGNASAPRALGTEALAGLSPKDAEAP